jgi:hypothetical protein
MNARPVFPEAQVLWANPMNPWSRHSRWAIFAYINANAYLPVLAFTAPEKISMRAAEDLAMEVLFCPMRLATRVASVFDKVALVEQ